MAPLDSAEPFRGVMQMAYVVKDIHASMHEWASKLKVGPWVLTPHFIGHEPVYRGQQVRADVSIAHSFAGAMNIELIQTNDTQPSVYRECIEARGYGFHHWGVATCDLDADVERYRASGWDVVFRVGVPGAGKVAFIDTRGAMPGFIELIQMNPMMERGLRGIFAAASRWDGSNPIRHSL